MAASVRIPIHHVTNLLSLFYVPCGAQVESKLLYLAEVLVYHSDYDKRTVSRHGIPKWSPDAQPKITLPLYSIPRSILAVTEDISLDAARANQDVQAKTCRAMKRKVERAADTVAKWPSGFAWVNDKEKSESMLATVGRLYEGLKFIVENGPGTDSAETEAEATVEMQPPESGDAGGSAEAGKYGGLPQPPPPPPTQDADEMMQQRKKRTLMKCDAKWMRLLTPPRAPPELGANVA